MLLLSTCTPLATPASPPLPSDASAPAPTPLTPTSRLATVPALLTETPPAEPPYVPEDILNAALDDLAARLSIPRGEIRAVSYEDVLWPDGSLGCPRPGVNYIQIQIEGYLLILEARGQVYEYHGGGNTPPFLCKPLS